MPGSKPLTKNANVLYLYDGSLNGFFCCVFESVYQHEIPFDICNVYTVQPSLMPQRYIETNLSKAERVYKSIPQKISSEALELVQNVFLSCLRQKELCMLRFLLLGYREGKKTTNMIGHNDVATMIDANKHLLGEAHLLTGFVRFEDYSGVLISTITPKNFILPFIARHFTQRYNNETFMIYDKTNKAALLYQDGKTEIVSLESVSFPEPSEKEKNYQALWKRFYKTIAIEARTNPRCRMTHMPKRYWENMTEVKDESLS